MAPGVDFAGARAGSDLVAIAGRYVELRRVGHEHHGPCPFCGGRDRFWVFKDGRRWRCRQCEKQGDATDLVAAMERVPLAEAARRLGAGDLPRRTSAPSAPPARAAAPSQDAEWAAKAARIMHAAGRRFLGSPGVPYLAGRGIDAETARAWRIGFFPEHFDPRDKSKRPALVIPWVDGSGAVHALKYRFVDPLAATDKGRRFTQKAGSAPCVCGLHLIEGGGASKSLIVVEGELNGLAVWQATRADGFDVVSAGSESSASAARSLGPLAALIRKRGYRRVLVWFDERERAVQAAKALGVRCAVLTSSGGQDANDVLRDGGADALAGRVRGALAGAFPDPVPAASAPQATHGASAAIPVPEAVQTPSGPSTARTTQNPRPRAWPKISSKPGSDFDRLTIFDKEAAVLAATIPGAEPLQAELSLARAHPARQFMRCWELQRKIVDLAERAGV